RSGRLVVPASLHMREGVSGFAPGVAMCYLSDDGGETWRRSETILHAPEGSQSGLQEPGIVELRDGRVMMLCRTDQGCQMRSWSSDGGESWTPPERTELLSPVSPATVKRIPKTGDLLLVWNDHRDIDPALQGKRTPLRAAISRDEGVSWENAKTLEEDPEGWFCYTAMEFVGDQVLLAYCATTTGLPHLSRTQITRFPVEWLYTP
ncbi:MAG TPA: sialidase family protein, partial [Armatimonadota bacterium]|nr:sialidase family protein [Armatimonadota bacterium]